MVKSVERKKDGPASGGGLLAEPSTADLMRRQISAVLELTGGNDLGCSTWITIAIV